MSETAMLRQWVANSFILTPSPGQCDPTYSFHWAYRVTVSNYAPTLGHPSVAPVVYGYPNLIYTSIYEDELMLLDNTHVKTN